MSINYLSKCERERKKEREKERKRERKKENKKELNLDGELMVKMCENV